MCFICSVYNISITSTRYNDMKILGIEFAPLNVPIHRRLQTVAVGLVFSFMFFSPFFGSFILIPFLFTINWFLTSAYLLWIWIFDRKTCETGGRRIECVRGSKIWEYFKEYFPINIEKDSEEVELDPKRNYLFCAFPHGILVTGGFTAFGTKAGGFHKLFPKHTPHILTLKQFFVLPLVREFILSMGMCVASAQSINYLMSKPNGGNAAMLVVGGVAEMFYCKPGQYQVLLQNRKGFARMALKNGSPLVPMYSFGETDLYDQFNNPEGSLLRMIQEWVKKITGIAPIVPLGRGYLQYSFGLIPYRQPINVIIGKPIDVEKVTDPTQEQIDSLHATFIKQLTELFEKHKHKYLENPDETTLVIN